MSLGYHAPHTKACKVCLKAFTPARPLQAVCSLPCARKVGPKARKDERAEDRAKREKLKPRSKLKSEAQDAFNDFVRFRDRDKPCVSCGVEDPPMTPGGQWDAGHFLSRGSHPELAFDEDNCHRQCKSCNAGGGKFKHKERTVTARYEEELIRRIGPERVARLRGPHPTVKRTADDFRELRDLYRAKLKAMKEAA